MNNSFSWQNLKKKLLPFDLRMDALMSALRYGCRAFSRPSFILVLSAGLALSGCRTAEPQGNADKSPRISGFRIFDGPRINEAGRGNVAVQILGINDLHGQLNVTRKFNGRNVGRADYLAAYLKQRAAENKNTLLLHAGDAVGASPPVSALLMDEPTIEILNQLRFDAGTIGNHEFDRGFDEMMRLIHGGSNPKTGKFKGAKFPYVCANVISKATGHPILPPYLIKRVQGVPIGIIGIILHETPDIVMPSSVAGLQFLDEADSINKAAADLKRQGVRTIVVLAHSPGTSNQDGSNPTGEIVDIANRVDDDVDVIFAGHSHQYLNAVVDGKLLVQAVSYGTHFTDVDLEIDPRTNDVVSKKAEIVPTYQDAIQPDPTIQQMVQGYEQKVGPVINQAIGTAARGLTRTQDANGESALGNLIADAQRAAMKTDFAFMNPGGIRSDIGQGQVTWGQLYTVQPFNNDLVKMTLTGEQVRRLLNQQWQQGKVAMLQISGLKYTWDSTRPEGDRVVDIFLPSGAKIDSAVTYTVTVNSFLASGGDRFTLLTEGTNRVIGPVDLDALITYVKQQPQPFSAAVEGRITKLK